jgi:hypothetical protein
MVSGFFLPKYESNTMCDCVINQSTCLRIVTALILTKNIQYSTKNNRIFRRGSRMEFEEKSAMGSLRGK